jgi:hypothetical protein
VIKRNGKYLVIGVLMYIFKIMMRVRKGKGSVLCGLFGQVL